MNILWVFFIIFRFTGPIAIGVYRGTKLVHTLGNCGVNYTSVF